MTQSATELSYPHPLIGQAARLLPGAAPAGWLDLSDDDNPADELIGETHIITDVATSEVAHPFGTIELAGWWWDPRHVVFARGF